MGVWLIMLWQKFEYLHNNNNNNNDDTRIAAMHSIAAIDHTLTIMDRAAYI